MLFHQDCMAYLCHNKMAILCIWWNARVVLTYAQPQTLMSQERLTLTDLQAFLAGGIFCYSYGTASECPSPTRTLRKPRLQWEGLTNTAVNQPRANPYIKRRILPIGSRSPSPASQSNHKYQDEPTKNRNSLSNRDTPQESNTRKRTYVKHNVLIQYNILRRICKGSVVNFINSHQDILQISCASISYNGLRTNW